MNNVKLSTKLTNVKLPAMHFLPTLIFFPTLIKFDST